MAGFGEWIGREDLREDEARVAPVEALAALLDHETSPWRAGELPPLAHWLYFLSAVRQSELGEDGHERRGRFLPPVDLPRRMWAGSEIDFHAPVPIGCAITRRSRIEDVREKHGHSGQMIFVRVQHDVSADGILAIRERQDIVYRAAPGASNTAPPPDMDHRENALTRSLTPGSTLLFRYSALTWNAHRIHYDRDYARLEGYPGLVVHGPLLATLLMDHFLRQHPQTLVRRFTFRAQRPLFDGEVLTLCLAEDGAARDLWVRGPDGGVAMTASVTPA